MTTTAESVGKNSTDPRAPALERALQQIEKQYGAGAVMKLGADYKYPGPPAIPTGSLSLDIATGIGGFPRARSTRGAFAREDEARRR